LYDLQNDIGESRNLREKQPEKYLTLKKKLISFFRNVK